jgi:serine protease
MTFRIWTGSAFENVSMAFSVNPDLAASRLVDASDFAFFDSGPVLDFDGHGTHVSSTIGEDTNNNLLLAGLAYNVRIMPVKVCIGYWEKMIVNGLTNTPGFASTSSSCVLSDIAAGIRYAADRGAQVINLSVGGPLSAPPANLRDALSYAVSQGTFSAISMGNNFEQGNETNYPAFFAQDLMGVMSVAAIGKTQTRSYYSATGAYCEIAAPGGDRRVGGTPDGGFIFQSTLDPDDGDPEFVRRPRFDRYVGLGLQGTSMASPHVAGLAALIAAQSPGITPADIERAIRATARDLGTPGKDNEYGHGLIQPRSVLFGWGLRK